MKRTYKVGRAYSVRLESHNEPAQMRSIELDGMNAGGGIMLIANRGDGEIERIVEILNSPDANECVSVQEAWEAAGGNPGIKAQKSDLLEALRQLDMVCDESPIQSPNHSLILESLRKDFERECEDTDKLLGMLGFNPIEVRTDAGSLSFSRLADLVARRKPAPQSKPLTDEQMEKGRDQIFSINNPFCPCDSKTFKKVAQWVERYHRIDDTAT